MSDNVSKSVFADLSSRERRAVTALLSGKDKDGAAAAAGVTRRTIDRYLNRPHVRAALDKATGAAVGDVARRMVGAMDTAVSVMIDLADNEETPATVRLRAAIAIIEHGPRLFEQHELIKRIDDLEEQINGEY